MPPKISGISEIPRVGQYTAMVRKILGYRLTIETSDTEVYLGKLPDFISVVAILVL